MKKLSAHSLKVPYTDQSAKDERNGNAWQAGNDVSDRSSAARRYNSLMRFSLLLLPIVFLGGCATGPGPQGMPSVRTHRATAPDIEREALIGTWYGSQDLGDGTVREWISHRLPDGSFVAEFRTREGDDITEASVEIGEWGLSYDLEIIITRGWIDGSDILAIPPAAQFWDLYRIESVNENGMTYVAYRSGERFKARRMPDDFTFTNGEDASVPPLRLDL